MLANGRRLGAHLPLGNGMVRAAGRAAEIGASAIQVFTDNPTSWHRRDSLPAELPAFRARLAELDIAPIAVHAPYLVNLAGSDDAFFERSVATMTHELLVAEAYGARYVNMHIGSHRGAGPETGALHLARGLRRVLDEAGDGAPGVTLVLENGAGSGFGMGVTIEDLAAIDDAAARAGVDRARVGFCLDTAHLWGAGYAIDRPEAVDGVLAELDARLGIERLRMIHLNDSREACGSRLDRHEHLGAGRIGTAGLQRFLCHPALDHVLYVIETPGMDAGYDAVNMARAFDIAAGHGLEPLPPEAFEVRSAKGRSAPAEHPEPRDDTDPAEHPGPRGDTDPAGHR
jgi:deoxyribonuclease-4